MKNKDLHRIRRILELRYGIIVIVQVNTRLEKSPFYFKLYVQRFSDEPTEINPFGIKDYYNQFDYAMKSGIEYVIDNKLHLKPIEELFNYQK